MNPDLPSFTAPVRRRSGWLRRIGSVGWKVAVALVLIPPLQVLELRFMDPPATTFMAAQAVADRLAGRRTLWRHENVPAGQVSPWLFKAILTAEDQRFYQHHGFDLVELENALDKHRRNPRRPLRGASTITQQLAKNLFLAPWRSFLRKGLEGYYTLWLELLWPKTRILEVYVNVVEFAPGVYGAQAAARHHFGKDAARLTSREAALLAAVLPNPRRWSAARPTDYINGRAEDIREQIRMLPWETRDDVPVIRLPD